MREKQQLETTNPETDGLARKVVNKNAGDKSDRDAASLIVLQLTVKCSLLLVALLAFDTIPPIRWNTEYSVPWRERSITME